MKTLLKPSLAVIAALGLIVALGLAMNAKRRDIEVLPQGGPPILRIDGKENPDVYLQSLDIQIEVTGNIASTRYTMVFKNRTNRILEGELTFPLPDGVTATHYALDINGHMREAVPVEKARATQVFEEIQRREVDPGILERVEGNNFRTRIYPFPRNGTRTISIGYEEELTLDNQRLYYRLPMAYPSRLNKFTVKATVWKGSPEPLASESASELRFEITDGNYVASFVRENYRPSRALVFALPAPADIPQVMMQPAQGSHYFLATVVPQVTPRKKQWSDDIAIIWDVSLSGSQRNLRRELEILNTIFAEKKNANAHLYFLNNRFTKIANKDTDNGEYRVVNGNWNVLRKVLVEAVFDGGTDFSQINLDSITGDEILFFSDGLSTLSDADFLKDADISRPIHCIISSAQADYGVMRLIAGETKGKFVNVNALSSAKLREELLYETLMFLGIEHGEGVREVYPTIAMPVHGVFSAAGISDVNNAELTLLFGFGSEVEKRIKVELDAKKAVDRGNIYRIWAQKKIAELDLDFENNREELTELGKQFGIVTRNTSLMVLEFLEDYIRFNIPPPPDLQEEYQRRMKEREQRGSQRIQAILAEVSEHKREEQPATSTGIGYGSAKGLSPREGAAGSASGTAVITQQGVLDVSSGQIKGRSNASSDVFGQGGFASDVDAVLSGVSGGGGGQRFGRRQRTEVSTEFFERLPEERRSNVSDDSRTGVTQQSVIQLKKGGELRVSSPDFLKGGQLTGGRTRASIQRIVIQNTPALRHQYNRRLRERPDLEGRITVKFTIDEFGKVLSAQLVASTIGDSTLEHSVVARVKTWQFEAIDKPGDVTTVTYPFVFSQSETPRQVMPLPPRPREATRDNMFDMAMRDAANLRDWRNVDFTPHQPKYPVPDSRGGVSNRDSIRGIFFGSNNYIRGLTGNTANDYQTYLKLRKNHANSPAFYFDVAHWFYTHNDRETALRILTSIADIGVENAPLYRMLGYRLREYGEYATAKFVFQKVMEWRPIEPQSYRDMALALADNGEAQAALEMLYSVLTRSFSRSIRDRSRGIEEVIVTEINHLIAHNPQLDISNINEHLIIDMPVDIRVVLNWNMDNIDIDLRVHAPTNSMLAMGAIRCTCSNCQRSGMVNIDERRSMNNTSGYGPEQLLVKNALKGRYQVYAHYSREREFAAAGPLVVMAEIFTNYGSKNEERQIVSVNMSEVRGTNNKGSSRVLVGEFEF